MAVHLGTLPLKEAISKYLQSHHSPQPMGVPQILEMFLSRGCNIEAKSHAGMTALHCAAASGSASVVKALVDHGANIRSEDTPYHLLPFRQCRGSGH